MANFLACCGREGCGIRPPSQMPSNTSNGTSVSSETRPARCRAGLRSPASQRQMVTGDTLKCSAAAARDNPLRVRQLVNSISFLTGAITRNCHTGKEKSRALLTFPYRDGKYVCAGPLTPWLTPPEPGVTPGPSAVLLFAAGGPIRQEHFHDRLHPPPTLSSEPSKRQRSSKKTATKHSPRPTQIAGMPAKAWNGSRNTNPLALSTSLSIFFIGSTEKHHVSDHLSSMGVRSHRNPRNSHRTLRGRTMHPSNRTTPKPC